MTANLFATVVENSLNRIDFENIMSKWDGIRQYDDSGRTTDAWMNRNTNDPHLARWYEASWKFEDYLKKNFLTFEITDLVYSHAKYICEDRINFENWYRAYGWYYTREEALKKWRR